MKRRVKDSIYSIDICRITRVFDCRTDGAVGLKCISQAYILLQQTFLRTFVLGSFFLESKRAGVRTSGFFQQD